MRGVAGQRRPYRMAGMVLRALLPPVLVLLLGCGPALAQDGPPKDPKATRKADLVELVRLDAGIKLDIRYAKSNNFLGKPVYPEARAFLQRPAAEALLRAHKGLAKHGYGLLIHDGYRPWTITKLFWDMTAGTPMQDFVANPKSGSKHNRGCAVDLTMYDLATGQAVQMPGEYDEPSLRSYPTFKGGTAEQRARRDLLRAAMEAEGFTVEPNEWWHFNYRDWTLYPILDISFQDAAKR